MTRHANSSGGEVRSIKRALIVLNALAEHRGGLILTDLVAIIDLPKSTTHRILTTLESGQYVQFDNTNQCWSIGTKLRDLTMRLNKIENLDAPGDQPLSDP